MECCDEPSISSKSVSLKVMVFGGESDVRRKPEDIATECERVRTRWSTRNAKFHRTAYIIEMHFLYKYTINLRTKTACI